MGPRTGRCPAKTGRLGPDRALSRLGQVLGCLTHLPITVGLGPLESELNVGTIKRSKGQDCSSTHGGLVRGCRQYCCQTGRVAYGTQGSNCRFAAQRVIVSSCDFAKRGYRCRSGGVSAFAEGPCRLLHNLLGGVREQPNQVYAWVRNGERTRSPADARVRVNQPGD